ncbi:MAG: aminoacyl-tRNA hydrolase [Gemmatimonadetes bacterium]|nr:aminoacyl-tRNA hydrolase [Gemmatimonadota bacterium]
MGLGNPGPRYDATRHNVGWWVVDRLAYDWDFGPFVDEGAFGATRGMVGPHEVEVRKPNTYMNRSGIAVADLVDCEGFEVERDLLVVIDDVALDVGRVRFRPAGGAGGHNGLRSVTAALGSDSWARLRLGVGRCPEGVDLVDWVLAPMEESDEERVIELLPEMSRAVELWLEEGTEAAMNRFNR